MNNLNLILIVIGLYMLKDFQQGVFKGVESSDDISELGFDEQNSDTWDLSWLGIG